MNRKEEYLSLISELDRTPAALEHVLTRAKARQSKSKCIRRFFAMPVSGFILFFAAFTAMVNMSMPFAIACGRIPLVRELAQYVAFSPSLSAAVDNAYVQPIELEQTQNNITMRVEYVIVDQKQLNIFYSLQSSTYTEMSANTSICKTDGTELESYSLSSGSPKVANGELRHVVVDFVNNDVPEGIMFTCKVLDRSGLGAQEPVRVDLFHAQHEEPLEPDYTSTFDFILSFEPYYTQQGESVTLNQVVILDGQIITVETVEIYPTHMRLNIRDDESNTAWLKGMSFYFENEKGERFEPISNGITATGAADSPMMSSHRLESSFFSESRSLSLYITDVVWLDKEMERLKVDLTDGTAESLPEGVKLEQAIQKPQGWELTFSGTEREENHSYQLFLSSYYDASGNEYSYNSWSSTSGYIDEESGKHMDTPGRFMVTFGLHDYYDDTVYLSPAFSRQTSLIKPVSVTVK